MFDPHLSVGQTLTENEVHDLFECQTTIGIRISKKNNLIVLISGSAKTKSYNDVWDGDVLYYIGTDINADENGNQTLRTGNGNNNKQLRDVWYEPEENKKQIFLFIKREVNKCVYKGPVKLIKEPYMDWRDEKRKNKVWIFPVQLQEIDSEIFRKEFKNAERHARNIELDELYEKVKGKAMEKQPSVVPKKYKTSSTHYERSPEISAFAKKRADGKCDLCGNVAPFVDSEGIPYLEAHHVEWLSKNGADEIDNVVALCPNCHRKMHVVNEKNDIERLNYRLNAYKKALDNLLKCKSGK